MDSYVRKCFIKSRDAYGGPVFVHEDDGTPTGRYVARLEHYAIVPIEDYVLLLPPEQAAEFQSLLPKSSPTPPPELSDRK